MRRDRPRGLAVFDLDGTLLRGPTVCEVLAAPLGRLPRMREIETLRARAEIEAARAEMAGWYVGTPVSALLDSLASVQLAPGAASGVALLRAHGVAVGVASITWSFAVDHLARQLGIEHTLGTVLQPSGRIEHVWAEHKAEWVLSLAVRLGVDPEHIAAVGDSAGDHPMLGVARRAVFVGAQAPPEREWLHRPAANLEDVARHLIEAWGV